MAPISDLTTSLIDRIPGLQETGMTLSNALHDLVRSGPFARSATDVLHGKQIGHPLHPILTDVTIGAWAFGAVFDLLSLTQSSRRARRQASDTADRLIGIGTLSAIPTALTGAADYSGLPREAMKVGTLHGLLNLAGFALYGLSMLGRKRGARRQSVALSLAGAAVLVASSYLGGELVYRLKVGVNRNLPESPEEQGRWMRALAVEQLEEGTPRRVELKDGQAVLLYRRGDTIYAIGAVCSHDGGPLEQGKFDGCCVECPWHHSVFDLSDGSVVHGPSVYSQPVYRTRVQKGYIQVQTVPEPPGEPVPPQTEITAV